MTLGTIFNNIVKTVKANSPEILTALGASGVITTSYLAAKGAIKATHKLEDKDPHMSNVERAKIVWKCYIPAGVAGTATIVCILGARQTAANRTAAAVAAYSLTERAFSEYKERVVDQIGKNKEEKIRNELAQERVSNNPPSNEVIMLGKGEVLCCELYTHRYFRSDMETLRKAQNDVNRIAISDIWVTLDEFYDLIGLPLTSQSPYVGWTSDRMMELEFSTTLSENGEPCLAFDYNYVKPIKD